MKNDYFNSLIPKLNPSIPLDHLSSILVPEEIQIIQYMDGLSSIALIAKLIGKTTEEVHVSVQMMEKKGIILFQLHKEEEGSLVDLSQASFSVSSSDSSEILEASFRYTEVSDPDETTIPFSLLEDLTPAMVEKSLNPQEVRLLVFIDGITEIQSLSTLFGTSVQEILLFCRNLAEKGFVRFKKRLQEEEGSQSDFPGFEMEEQIVAPPPSGSLDESSALPSVSFHWNQSSLAQEGQKNSFSQDIESKPHHSFLYDSDVPQISEENLSFELDYVSDLLDSENNPLPKELITQEIRNKEKGSAMIIASEPLRSSSIPLKNSLFQELQKHETQSILEHAVFEELLPALSSQPPLHAEEPTDEVPTTSETYRRTMRKEQNIRTSAFLVRDSPFRANTEEALSKEEK